MALIKCSECGKEFSSKAKACPNCACPIEEIEEMQYIETEIEATTSKNIEDDSEIINEQFSFFNGKQIFLFYQL